MALKNWPLIPSAATETDLVAGTTGKTTYVKHVLITNHGSGTANIELRLTDASNNLLAMQGYPRSVAIGNSIKIPVELNIEETQKLRATSSIANVSFTANGDDDFSLTA
jgi:hypothetical protein